MQDASDVASGPFPIALLGNFKSTWVHLADGMDIGVDLFDSGNMCLARILIQQGFHSRWAIKERETNLYQLLARGSPSLQLLDELGCEGFADLEWRGVQGDHPEPKMRRPSA